MTRSQERLLLLGVLVLITVLTMSDAADLAVQMQQLRIDSDAMRQSLGANQTQGVQVQIQGGNAAAQPRTESTEMEEDWDDADKHPGPATW